MASAQPFASNLASHYAIASTAVFDCTATFKLKSAFGFNTRLASAYPLSSTQESMAILFSLPRDLQLQQLALVPTLKYVVASTLTLTLAPTRHLRLVQSSASLPYSTKRSTCLQHSLSFYQSPPSQLSTTSLLRSFLRNSNSLRATLTCPTQIGQQPPTLNQHVASSQPWFPTLDTSALMQSHVVSKSIAVFVFGFTTIFSSTATVALPIAVGSRYRNRLSFGYNTTAPDRVLQQSLLT